MSDKQKTIKAPISFEGKGLHLGQHAHLTIHPAKEHHGFKFQRSDIEGKPIIHADVDNVTSTIRSTSLAENGHEIHTVEHVLASLFGLEIDNALIEVSGPEIPILDGSCKDFVEAIERVGIEEQNADKNYFTLDANMAFENTEKEAEILAVPTDGGEFRITVMVDYKSPLLGTQHASMYHLGEFKEEISTCRTFVFLRELMGLVNAGLIKGGDVDNAIVMVDTTLSEDEKLKLAETFDRDVSELQEIGIGILNNVDLRFRNEPARHKLLDIIGDLALVGRPLKGHILAARPGHTSNVEFAKKIRQAIRRAEDLPPKFDVNAEPVRNIIDITKTLPHRYPILLVDRIIHLTEERVVGIKNITRNEPYFDGHFPNEPVMPGVLQIEALAQCGGILALNTVEDPTEYATYFLKIDKVRFKSKVVPGDVLTLDLKLMTPIRRGIVQMKARTFVGDRLATEGELMAQIVKNK